MTEISANLNNIKEKVSNICAKIGRDPSEIAIVGVIKNIDESLVLEGLLAGLEIIGENKVQEAVSRIPKIRQKFPNVSVHMIGHLQTNKINQALPLFDLFQSVDSIDLANAINKRGITPVEIFLEVNTSFEQSKFGFSPEDVFAAVDSIQKMQNLKISGLMTIGPLTDDRETMRKSFALLRTTREKLNDRGYKKIKKLSMGMSADYDMAIEEGSDIIRIGRAIFGDRKPK